MKTKTCVRNFRNANIILLIFFPAASALGFSQREINLRLYSKRADFEFRRIFLDKSEQRVSIIFLTSVGFLQRHSRALLQLKQLQYISSMC